jgi:hypothetical protein
MTTPDPPIYERIMRDAERFAGRVEHTVEHRFDAFRPRHGTSEPPASQPVTVNAGPRPAKEPFMSLLDTITEDVKSDLTQGVAYLKEFAGRLEQVSPSIISTAETLGGSTVGKLIEAAAGTVLPADVESELVNIVKTYVTRFGSATTTPAVPSAPVAAAPSAPVAEAVAQPVQ